jgi:hypothetical protein
MIVTGLPWYTPRADATWIADTPISRHRVLRMFARCSGEAIQSDIARPALRFGDAHTMFSPTDQNPYPAELYQRSMRYQNGEPSREL